MENMQDFVIENGVLTRYIGLGGDVTIPAGVTKIGECAFYGCIEIDEWDDEEWDDEEWDDEEWDDEEWDDEEWDDEEWDDEEWDDEEYVFGRMDLTSVTIPEGVTEIGDEAFAGCTGLTSVTIPEGVTKIWNSAFEGCANLTSVTIPGSVKEIGKYVFQGCRPALITPHIPISSIAREDKPGACAGFAKAYLDGWEIDEDIKAGYLKYIKGQKKWLFPLLVQHEELLRLMFAEKMIVRKDIDPLLEECDRQNNISAKAAVLDYAGRNLKPVDPTKEFKLKGL